MMSFSTLLLISISAIAGVLGAPQGSEFSIRQTSISPGDGTNNGYYYDYWSDGNPQEDVALGSGGSYSINWSGNHDFFAGKGWNPGSAQTIKYTGTFSPENGTAYLSVYGWTLSPLVEYYILESYTGFDPSSDATFKHKGSVTSDGGTYDIYDRPVPNNGKEPGLDPHQYWSVRTDKRVGGTVTTANHFDAWKAAGMDLGTFNYQIVAIEGNDGSGSSSITIL